MRGRKPRAWFRLDCALGVLLCIALAANWAVLWGAEDLESGMIDGAHLDTHDHDSHETLDAFGVGPRGRGSQDHARSHGPDQAKHRQETGLDSGVDSQPQQRTLAPGRKGPAFVAHPAVRMHAPSTAALQAFTQQVQGRRNMDLVKAPRSSADEASASPSEPAVLPKPVSHKVSHVTHMEHRIVAAAAPHVAPSAESHSHHHRAQSTGVSMQRRADVGFEADVSRGSGSNGGSDHTGRGVGASELSQFIYFDWPRHSEQFTLLKYESLSPAPQERADRWVLF